MSALILPEDEAFASLFPLNLRGDVVALRACIDAGTQKGVFALAAVAFGYSNAVKANNKWERLLKGRTFHMTDLHARKGEFCGIEDVEVDAIMKGTVAIIREYASCAVAVSCDAELIADSLPTIADKHPDMENLLAAMRSTYGFMCHFAMAALGAKANKGGPGRNISYVFERGDEGQRGLRRYLETLDGEQPHHRLLLNGYSFNRLTITPKEELEGLFHSSDLLAWEWARHIDRHRRGEPMRKSLAAIIGGNSLSSTKNGLVANNGIKVFGIHFHAERIAPLAEYFRNSLTATSLEETAAAFEKYRERVPGAAMSDDALARLLQRGF